MQIKKKKKKTNNLWCFHLLPKVGGKRGLQISALLFLKTRRPSNAAGGHHTNGNHKIDQAIKQLSSRSGKQINEHSLLTGQVTWQQLSSNADNSRTLSSFPSTTGPFLRHGSAQLRDFALHHVGKIKQDLDTILAAV